MSGSCSQPMDETCIWDPCSGRKGRVPDDGRRCFKSRKNDVCDRCGPDPRRCKPQPDDCRLRLEFEFRPDYSRWMFDSRGSTPSVGQWVTTSCAEVRRWAQASSRPIGTGALRPPRMRTASIRATCDSTTTEGAGFRYACGCSRQDDDIRH